jgi:hypothetical protein
VVGGLKMVGGVFVFGRIATANVSANQAEAQMHPDIPDFDTFFADMNISIRNLDLVGVGASHNDSCVKNNMCMEWIPRPKGTGLINTGFCKTNRHPAFNSPILQDRGRLADQFFQPIHIPR